VPNDHRARRAQCNRCGERKPRSIDRMDERRAPSDGRSIPLPRSFGSGAGAQPSKGGGYHEYYREGGGGYPAACGGGVSGGGGSSRPPPPNIDPSGGDWSCPSCSNWNFARRDECNKCGAKHPTRAPRPPSKKDQLLDRAAGLDTSRSYGTAGSNGKRTGEGGGFREFDAEEDDRRKRRAIEDRAAKEERKAEKKKCEYCKVRRERRGSSWFAARRLAPARPLPSPPPTRISKKLLQLRARFLLSVPCSCALSTSSTSPCHPSTHLPTSSAAALLLYMLRKGAGAIPVVAGANVSEATG
jgi:hypothetical protein